MVLGQVDRVEAQPVGRNRLLLDRVVQIGDWRVRLLVDAAGRAQADAMAFTPSDAPVDVQLADAPVDAPQEFLRFKTTRREHYERFSPSRPGVFDTLLWNSRGEVTPPAQGTGITEPV